jgi:uncharacterized repeat protein (TIGR03803 family)
MLTTLYSFCSKSGCTDGADPLSALIQATNGDLYGTTASGGVNCAVGGVIPGCGTIYKITPGGALTTLYSFCSLYECADGETPQQGALVQGEDGDFYGTTPFGLNNGTIFKITPRGKLTTLYSFCSLSECADGEVPFAGLVQATNGIIYGTTYNGGTGTSCSGGCGTVFSLSTGQAPFVETVPTIGVVGERVRILGYKLTGATTVTFNGVPAAFTVDAETEITTKVPAGATTGEVEVVTPDGALSTKVAFEVAP